MYFSLERKTIQEAFHAVRCYEEAVKEHKRNKELAFETISQAENVENSPFRRWLLMKKSQIYLHRVERSLRRLTTHAKNANEVIRQTLQMLKIIHILRTY